MRRRGDIVSKALNFIGFLSEWPNHAQSPLLKTFPIIRKKFPYLNSDTDVFLGKLYLLFFSEKNQKMV